MDIIEFGNEDLSCAVNTFGAELWQIRDADGRDWLWDGDPRWWTGRAPILFPIVGMLRDGRYRWSGDSYALEKHGFARRSQFDVVEADSSSATFRLTPNEQIRAAYPFDFQLDLRFSAGGGGIRIEAIVANNGDGPMPFSFGFHPALRWPLPNGRRDGSILRFDSEEPGAAWRMNAEGLLDRTEPSPIDGAALELRDDLFAEDAMIWRDVRSRGATLECGAASARVDWDNLPDLGLWTKPGAPYLCIEPWQGFNDPVGFEGELSEKPGMVTLAPHSDWRASMRISVG